MKLLSVKTARLVLIHWGYRGNNVHSPTSWLIFEVIYCFLYTYMREQFRFVRSSVFQDVN